MRYAIVRLFALCSIVLTVLVACGGGGGGGGGSSSGGGGGSSVVTAPTGVGTSAGNGQITISWTAVSGATSYNIYWALSPGVSRASTKISGVTSPYVHGSLANGTTYYYVVTAVNSGGESAVSSEVFDTPTLAPPPPP